MRFIVAAVILISLAAGAYLLYQTEPVHSLFGDSRSEDQNPLSFLDEEREIITPKKEPPRRSAPDAPPPPSRPQRPSEPESVGPPDVPNAQVSRVLISILKAQGLAYGLSLSVTDRELEVAGEVDSEEKRRQIIDILNKGRGRRALNTEYLVVKPN